MVGLLRRFVALPGGQTKDKLDDSYSCCMITPEALLLDSNFTLETLLETVLLPIAKMSHKALLERDD